MIHKEFCNLDTKLRIDNIQSSEFPETLFSHPLFPNTCLQLFQKLLAILSAVLAMLLKFNYVITEEPISCSKSKVDGMGGLLL